MGHSRPLFLYFRLFNTVIVKYKIAHDWFWTSDLRCRKGLLCQLCHNHCPKVLYILKTNISSCASNTYAKLDTNWSAEQSDDRPDKHASRAGLASGQDGLCRDSSQPWLPPDVWTRPRTEKIVEENKTQHGTIL